MSEPKTIYNNDPQPKQWSGPLYEVDPSRTIQIGSLLLTKERVRVVTLLRKNADIFAWSVTNMPEIDIFIIEHELNVDQDQKLVK